MEEDCIYYKYVPHHQKKEWEAAGWVFDGDFGPPHAAYASLYRWEMEGKPVIPDNINIVIIRESTETRDGEE